GSRPSVVSRMSLREVRYRVACLDALDQVSHRVCSCANVGRLTPAHAEECWCLAPGLVQFQCRPTPGIAPV
ncbi:hypothetical protein HAX54_051115, partial [Datura stramonium]|nr:hypothetical protein [Datura stramonium]